MVALVLLLAPVLWRELFDLLSLLDLISVVLVLLLEDEDCDLAFLSLERGSRSLVCSFGCLKSNSKLSVLEC